jgi:uncharacterized membrane protein YkoI
MKSTLFVIGLALLLTVGCASLKSAFDGDEEIPLSKVPEPALAAARDAVPGIVLTEASMEEEDGRMVYELEGTADGKEYEIEVTADGRVLEIEQDDED